MAGDTHELLRRAAIAWLKRQEYDYHRDEPRGGGCSLIASELVTASDDIPDAIGWQSFRGSSVMVECKASRADFAADAKKPQRLIGTGVGERRYFCTPPALLDTAELPEGWGLLELHGKTMKVIRKAPCRELDLQGHHNEKKLLLSLVRRIRLREFLIISPERMDDVLANDEFPEGVHASA